MAALLSHDGHRNQGRVPPKWQGVHSTLAIQRKSRFSTLVNKTASCMKTHEYIAASLFASVKEAPGRNGAARASARMSTDTA